MATRIADPIAAGLYRLNIAPNHLSVLQTVLAGLAASMLVYGRFSVAAAFYVGTGVLQAADGAMTRLLDKSSPFSAFMNAVLKRVSESLLYVGLTYYFADAGLPLLAGVATMVLFNAMLGDYVSQQAARLRLTCAPGFLTRFDRQLLLIAGLFLNLIGVVLVILFLLSTITVLQLVVNVGTSLQDD